MKKTFLSLCIILISLNVFAYNKEIKPINVQAKQNIYAFVHQDDADVRLTSQEKQNQAMRQFFQHFFSPWHSRKNKTYASMKKIVVKNIHFYKNHLGWGENFHHHNKKWMDGIAKNIHVSNFPNKVQSAITVNNAYVRALPTIEPHFNNFRLAGEGYPFDNLQETVVWAGTPIRVLHLTRDGAWAFIQSPSVSGWIQIEALAFVDHHFINVWKRSRYVATIANEFPMRYPGKLFRFRAYMGSLFPLRKQINNKYSILIPVPNLYRQALIKHATVTNKQVRPMPLSPTRRHFALLINELLGTPYGWGGLYFYNDCSGTLKSLFTPFGIWLPRNSTAQGNAGRVTILNTMSAYRQKATLRNVTPFLTLIHLPGHIMLYIGAKNGELFTFQNLWAFIISHPNAPEGRAVIGKAAIMKFYPYQNVPYKMIELI